MGEYFGMGEYFKLLDHDGAIKAAVTLAYSGIG